MCTALLRLDRTGASDWPVLLAFIRDEDRSRAWDLPARWWAPHQRFLGGRDTRSGGTWLAVDDDPTSPAVAFLLNRMDVNGGQPQLAAPISRGTLPLHALQHRYEPLNGVPLERYEPYNLIRADRQLADWWRWNGEQLDRRPLVDGWHMIGSCAPEALETEAREAVWLPRVAALAEPREAALEAERTDDVWCGWPELLDGRAAEVGDRMSLVLAGDDEHPQFGTVAGTLVAIHTTGRVRVDINASQTLDPDAWIRVSVERP